VTDFYRITDQVTICRYNKQKVHVFVLIGYDVTSLGNRILTLGDRSAFSKRRELIT
jgi:hypothetical protein